MTTVNKYIGQTEQNHTHVLPWASVYAISAAVLVSIFILAVIGFASPEVIHNAAHDIRHSMVFPCH